MMHDARNAPFLERQFNPWGSISSIALSVQRRQAGGTSNKQTSKQANTPHPSCTTVPSGGAE